MRALAVFLLLIGSLPGCRQSSPNPPSETSALDESRAAQSAEARGSTSTGTVTFQIQNGDEVVTFDVEEVADGATLESVMRRIDQVPISIRGSGVTAFVDQIGDTTTSGSEGWTYQIDGEFANRGIGETTLSPPTTVEWSFGGMPEP